MAEIRVPTLGESVTEATVATWFKKVGDPVKVDEMLCELETDKVTVEVPATAAGVLAEIVAKEGETVGVDALLATIDEKAAANPAPAKAARQEASTEAEAGKTAPDDAESAPANEQAVEIAVPTLGESVTEATVSTWFKKVGDAVTQDEMLCELETDKVSVEVPAPASGTLAEIYAKEGATVQAGGKLGRIGGSAAAAAGSAARERAPAAATAAPAAATARRDVENAPSANKAMADRGIDPGSVKGSGRDGRIMKEDVLRSEAPNPIPFPAPAPSPEPAPIPRAPVLAEDAAREERVKMTRLRQTIARRLKEAQNTAAMLTTYNEVDMTGVMELRNEYKELFEKKHGVKLGFMSFFTKACCHALVEVPEVNAEIDGTDIVYKHFVHMGIAVGTPSGLVVPVVRDADQLSFAQIEKTHQRARRPRPRRQALDGRDAGRHLHHLERRRLRQPDVLADPEPAAVGHPRHAQDPGAADGDQGRDRAAADDVPGALLRPPRRRRQGCGHLPRPRQGGAGGPAPAADGSLTDGGAHHRPRLARADPSRGR